MALKTKKKKSTKRKRSGKSKRHAAAAGEITSLPAVPSESGESEPRMPFLPSNNQLRFAEQYLTQTKKSSITKVARAIGLSRQSIYEWFDNPEFCDWIIEMHRKFETMMLSSHSIGMKKALERGDVGALRLWAEGHTGLESERAPKLEIYISEVKTPQTSEEIGSLPGGGRPV